RRLVRPNFTTQSHTSRLKKAPSAALEGQDDNSPGQARHERRPGENAHTNPVSLFPVLPRILSGQNRKKGGFHFWFPYPGRRSACPGLLSYHPYGISVWLALLANCRTPSGAAAAGDSAPTKPGSSESPPTTTDSKRGGCRLPR